ncbi:MAG: hypothetical protein N4A49_02770 [Marinifilaceae bacterium]|nr:hypothetical protein [Marinifilaceae bacterium]
MQIKSEKDGTTKLANKKENVQSFCSFLSQMVSLNYYDEKLIEEFEIHNIIGNDIIDLSEVKKNSIIIHNEGNS